MSRAARRLWRAAIDTLPLVAFWHAWYLQWLQFIATMNAGAS